MKKIRSLQVGSIHITVKRGAFDWFWDEVADNNWEFHTFALIRKFVSRRTQFFDLGAWIGPITLYAAHFAKNVFAFEPDPAAFTELSRNIKLNPRHKNIVLSKCAISPSSGLLTMGNKSRPGNSRSSIFYSQEPTSWNVDSINLVEYIGLNKIQPPYFFKIDIEGAEFDVIASLRPVFKKYESILYLSLHPQFPASLITGGSLVAKIRRRVVLLRTYLRLIQHLRYLKYKYDVEGNRIRLANLKLLINGLLIREDVLLAMNHRSNLK